MRQQLSPPPSVLPLLTLLPSFRDQTVAVFSPPSRALELQIQRSMADQPEIDQLQAKVRALENRREFRLTS